ncbi:magnesium/cobalt transporter CorA [Pseudodesulfovibrio sediminis]|uniref:Magnesium transport protein CorA n=1 Tax=Pseudodesulfovibrio sediminis TaxID=2810563 RepID=A0ABN6ELI4_9BACT|nr:magnesium/cobalt transporter CorA [Pseudodesulfovibrio sediminis]BCS86910.1 magnesium and cobalt transport protein CorA [Pseudodesulfovibrio sediminis]
MFDFLHWNQVKNDAAPGTLVYAGAKREFTPFVLHYAYNKEQVVEARYEDVSQCLLKKDMINLLVVTGVHVPDMIKSMGTTLNLPLLTLEDVMNTGQRPKMSWADDDTSFIVMKHVDVKNENLESQQVSIFWRDGLVILFLEKESDLLTGLINRINKGKGRIRNSDSSYLLTAILDTLVDREMATLGQLSEIAQDLENQLGQRTTDDLLGKLYELKRETILLRNILVPVREIFKNLMHEDAEIPETVLPFLRDTAGHQDQIVEGVTALHDILKSMVDYQISLIGIRTNNVMQFLTVIATIFIPLTFIAGVYGMNFQYMPELAWRYGYFYALGAMGVVGLAMLIYFMRKKFL